MYRGYPCRHGRLGVLPYSNHCAKLCTVMQEENKSAPRGRREASSSDTRRHHQAPGLHCLPAPPSVERILTCHSPRTPEHAPVPC